MKSGMYLRIIASLWVVPCLDTQGAGQREKRGTLQPPCSCSFDTRYNWRHNSVATQKKINAPIISRSGCRPVIFLAGTNFHSRLNYITHNPHEHTHTGAHWLDICLIIRDGSSHAACPLETLDKSHSAWWCLMKRIQSFWQTSSLIN